LGSDTVVEANNTDNDWLHFGAMTDGATIDLSSTATQTVVSGLLDVTLSSSTGIESVIGTNYVDHITGNSRDNGLHGEGGNDVMSGGDGNEWFFGGAGNDQLTGNAGNDFFYGEQGDDTMTGNAGDDTYPLDALAGNLGSDTVVESANADTDWLHFGA